MIFFSIFTDSKSESHEDSESGVRIVIGVVFGEVHSFAELSSFIVIIVVVHVVEKKGGA